MILSLLVSVMRVAPARANPGPPDAESTGRGDPPWALFAAAVGLLVLATWLYGGYAYNSGNTPGVIAHVLRFSGELQGDWYTSLPPSHWAVDHALALLPGSLLEPAILGLWILFLAVLWAAFLDICRSLGAPLYVGVTAGLILIPTKLGGFGVSEILFDFFYPNGLSFALVVLAVALILRNRMTWAGVALGASIVVHPAVGPLAIAAITPMALIAMDRIDLRSVSRFVAPIAIIGAAPFAQLLLDSISGSSLSDHERYEFVALVRQGHHVLYRIFPTFEYVRTGLWLGALAISLGVLWRMQSARLVAILTATCLLLCALGAAASELEWPFLLVNAQTSRLSALFVLLAVAGIAGALTRMISPVAAALALLVVFLISPELHTELVSRYPSWGTLDAAEAILLLLALVASLVLYLARDAEVDQSPPRTAWRPLAAAAVAIAFAVAATSLLVERADRAQANRDPVEDALKQVAAEAEQRTEPGELVLGSPTDDGLRAFARRPTVVEYGFIRLGEGDDEWRQRVFDLTGNPHVLDPDAAGTGIVERKALIDSGYQRTIETSRLPICRYDAKVVIATPQTKPPPWLTPVYRNDYFALYDVKPGTCSTPG
jgi:hypothetical protein